MGIYSGLILLILLGRAAFVFPLSAFANYMNRHAEQTPSITFKHQVTKHVLYDILFSVTVKLRKYPVIIYWLLKFGESSR